MNVPEWSPDRLVMERMRAHLSMCVAIIGSNSLIRTPGTLVGMAPYGPRMLTGAPGLGSNVSKWLGPPLRKMKMHAGSCFCVVADARPAPEFARVRPSA